MSPRRVPIIRVMCTGVFPGYPGAGIQHSSGWGGVLSFYIIFEPFCLQKSPTSSFCVDKTVLGELLVSWVQTFPGCFVGHHFHLGFLLRIMKEEMEIMRKIRPWAVPSVPLTLLW